MKKLIILLVVIFSFLTPVNVSAQCSMCSANAEMGSKNGNSQTAGINTGVLYLLSFPFLLASGIGLLWYTKFRTRKI